MLTLAPTSTTLHELVLDAGPDVGRRIALADAVTRIGRSLHADIPFESPTISRRHALVVLRDGDAVLLDDRSLNGTWVNGEPIDEVVLQDGDVIGIGDALLRYRRDEAGHE
jgi:pSer/pThr/pTyr-binding forkhead associated (FHA) protein